MIKQSYIQPMTHCIRLGLECFISASSTLSTNVNTLEVLEEDDYTW